MNIKIRTFTTFLAIFLMVSNALASGGMDLLDQENTEEVQGTKKSRCPQQTPEGWSTQQYIDHYLKDSKGNGDTAWFKSYADRYCEADPFQNLDRRDAEHYLWSYQDVQKNSYQWLPSIIRTVGYSTVKVPKYYGKAGYNNARSALGYKRGDNTTQPTMSELYWGLKGSQDALFGLD